MTLLPSARVIVAAPAGCVFLSSLQGGGTLVHSDDAQAPRSLNRFASAHPPLSSVAFFMLAAQC